MKREYAKPEMQQVRLKAEEAVLTSCKAFNLPNTGALSSGVGACEQLGPNDRGFRCFLIGS